eukprot:gb/GEZN01010184.1/.p1 GENE.gb/GEZN01010184.1/~~gb/GEZN01010184.1/.p1  ORF type:complete len:353 (-),score=42.65 gb/GEZN01010184.1/:102-1160(-)
MSELQGEVAFLTHICAELTPIKFVRYTISMAIFVICCTVIFFGIGSGFALLPGPIVAHFIILILALTMLGYLEGLQVAVLALQNLEYNSVRDRYPSGCKLMDRAIQPHVIKKFLTGRQFFTVFIVFLIAQLTTFPDFPQGPLPTWLFILLINTGLAGALFILMLGQLLTRITGSVYPMQFCNLPGARYLFYACLGFELLGITEASFLLAASVRWMLGLKLLKYAQKKEDGVEMDRLVDQDNGGYTYLASDSYDYRELNWQKIFEQAQKANLQSGKLDPELVSQLRHFPSTEALSKMFLDQGKPLPRFLLPEMHPMHISPHLAVAQMLFQPNLPSLKGQVDWSVHLPAASAEQ